MAIDWTKVGEQAIVVVPTALASGYIGARIKAHLDRARIAVSIESCALEHGRALLNQGVEIDQKIRQQYRQSPWLPALGRRENAAKLEEHVERLHRSIKRARDVLDYLETKSAELAALNKPDDKTKRAFLDAITLAEVSIILEAIIGGMVRKEVMLDLPPQDQLNSDWPALGVVTEREEKDGYLVDIGHRWIPLVYEKSKHNMPFLEPAARAFSHFHTPSLSKLLEYAKMQITRWAAEGDSLVATMENLLRQHCHLMLEVSLANRGRTSALFTKWGLLSVFGADVEPIPEIKLVRANMVPEPTDPVLVLQQEAILKEIDDPDESPPQGFALEGGQTMKLTLRSLDTLAEIEKRIPNFEGILKLNVYFCQVALRRADSTSVKRAWLTSSRTRFGQEREQFPMDDLPRLKRIWDK